MKSLVLLVFGLVSANALDKALVSEHTAMLMEFGLECVESEKATPEDIEALKEHNPPVTHQGRCVLFCVSKKLNLMNDDGFVSATAPSNPWIEKVKVNDPEIFETLQKIHQTCAAGVENKGDGCDTAFEFVKCMKSEAQKVGIDKILEDSR